MEKNNKILYITTLQWPDDIRIFKQIESLKKNKWNISILMGNQNSK